jgi:hypothetical protein
MRLLTLILVLATNAVPIYGALRLGWSAPTLLVLFWSENAIGIVFTVLRIWLHRRLTRKRGHWNTATQANVGTSVKQGDRTTLLASYAIPSTIFTAAHAIFVFAIAFMFSHNHPGDAFWQFSSEQLWIGLQWITGFMLVDFAKDLVGLRKHSYAWIKRYSDQRMGRVIVLHLGIIFGMGALAWFESPLAPLCVLMGLKALLDLAWSWGGGAEPVPAEPPAWSVKAVGALRGLAPEMNEEQFKRMWQAEREAERRAAIENELPLEP